VPNARPYDRRHSFVSLPIVQGVTVVEVASQAGHAPTMTLDTYAHLFNDLADGERTSAEDLIRASRHKPSPRMSPFCVRTEMTSQSQTRKIPGNP
jgi:hypothetical protein